MTYLAYAYIVSASTQVGVAGIGVFWLLSTPAQQFIKYEVWYSIRGVLGIVLPVENMQYMGLAETVFPGISSVQDLLSRFRITIEVWAGMNMNGGLDLYHRTLVAGTVVFQRWARWYLPDESEPSRWFYASRGEFWGTYDLQVAVANPIRARL